MQRKPPQADASELARALQEGVALQRAARHTEAETHYLKALTRSPGNPDLLQLLGAALKAQGKAAEAERRLRDSLAARPGQPHVWANLGNLLADLNRWPEAVAAFKEALKIDDRAIAAWLGLGAALLAQGDVVGAGTAYERSRAIDAKNASALIGLAQVAGHKADDATAERLLREALALEPSNVPALNNLGMTLAQRGDGKAALPLMNRALALRPRQAQLETGLAFALQVSGDVAAAIDHYRRALAINPLHLAAHENLARLLWQTSDRKRYLADLEETIARFPNVPQLHVSRANLLSMAERFTEAEEAYGRANALQPESLIPLDGMARMAAERGDKARCLTLHERAVRHAPQQAGFIVSRAHALLRFREFAQAVTALEQVLALDPDHQLALGDLTLALRGAGDAREQWLADYERLAQAIELPPPRGYADMEAFNRDLDAALDELHVAKTAPVDQTLRHGTQTFGSLFGRGIDLVTRLRETIDAAVAAYIRALPDDPTHPFLRRKTAHFRHRGSWSSRLTASGHHVPHVHPDGWISSAYYVALPPAVEDGRQGWFALGAPPFDLGWAEPVRRFIRPRRGTLILFPSYFYHATVPFDGGARTTIAFDAVPAS